MLERYFVCFCISVCIICISQWKWYSVLHAFACHMHDSNNTN